MLYRHLVMAIALVLFTAGWAQADINAYLHDLNVSAQGNLGGFRTEVGARFGASGPQVDIALRSADSPADAAVCLWLAQQSRQPVDVVLREYRASKNQGWGTLAKNLGIKPGSAAFK
ncbi:MAG: hypothetical protein GWN87_13425, partial [Desulfuromonadales bacterium]|nr:hypothetical protein [Desulfuromonadales bacterium]NIS41380.1 hypothetical protein [Desulfuromonadales bacterium]